MTLLCCPSPHTQEKRQAWIKLSPMHTQPGVIHITEAAMGAQGTVKTCSFHVPVLQVLDKFVSFKTQTHSP